MQRNTQMQIHEFVQDVFHFFYRCLYMTEKYNDRIRERYENDKEVQDYLYGEHNGLSIGLAHHIFGYIYSGYTCFFSFIILGLAQRYLGTCNDIIVIIIVGLPIGICYIPAYKALYTNNRYLSFFAKFKKRDDKWHNKWKKITIVFCIGDLIMMGLGILSMCLILVH